MYGPTRPREKKTSIIRSRTGCKECRRRKRKCDEKKPSCGTCSKLGCLCEPASPKLRFRDVTSSFANHHVKQQGEQNDRDAAHHLQAHSAAVSPPEPNHSFPEASLWLPHRGSRRYSDTTSLPAPSASARDSTGIWRHRMLPPAPALLPQSLMPHYDAEYPVLFYMNTWQQQCLPALHYAFQQADTLSSLSPLCINMMVALSAGRLSRNLPQRKLIRSSNAPGLSFRPDIGHENVSHKYYSTALSGVARWDPQNLTADPFTTLALLLLFSYMESSMGNFKAFRLHCNAAKQIIEANAPTLSDGDRRSTLVEAWVEIEMQYWWRRVYFGTPAFHNEKILASDSIDVQNLLPKHSSRALLLSILCESHRLNMAAVLSLWNQEDSFSAYTSDECFALLCTESNLLDEWYERLHVKDLPSPPPQSDSDEVGRDGNEPAVSPLVFSTHRAAMNFAYYITSRVLQCPAPLHVVGLNSPTQVDEAYTEAEAWINMLLQVAAGINWDQCLRLNTYAIGFSGLLLACLLRSRAPKIGIQIQSWLEQHLRGDQFEEGNFPVFQILEAVRLINRERYNGQDVFALFQVADDGGGCGKLSSYHSQQLTSLVVYARDSVTGLLHTYYRSL